MTDNEIIKALNACVTTPCNRCPLCNDPCEIDYGGVPYFIIEIINRQKAEIEELKKVVIDDYAIEYDSKIKAEAIKEFAERFKSVFPCVVGMYRVHNESFDNLVKEMVGTGNSTLVDNQN